MSAYCFYYSGTEVYISSQNDFMNATSNNIYGYASVWVNDELEVGGHRLAECKPSSSPGNTCSTSQAGTFTYEANGKLTYVMICLECHYWLLYCDFDAYNFCISGNYKSGYVDCPSCN